MSKVPKLSDTQTQALQRFFERYDTDKNGFLSFYELSSFFYEVLGEEVEHDTLLSFWEEVDPENTGYLSFDDVQRIAVHVLPHTGVKKETGDKNVSRKKGQRNKWFSR